MAKDTEINLKITSDGLERFCEEIAVGSANTQRKHAAFMALEAFITRHAGADAHTQAYNHILEIIERFSTSTRSSLLTENSVILKSALCKQKPTEIARIFVSVSRNGFNQILTQTINILMQEQLDDIRPWVADWCVSAKEKGQKASGYPDAMDFRKTDIDLLEYTAMSEINKLLQGE